MIAGALLLAYALRFLQDDAFISFRYAENFSLGLGLAWEPEVFVQGYTNFLWTFWLGLVASMGAPIEAAAVYSGLGAFVFGLFLAYSTYRKLFPGTLIPIALLAILSTNFSYLAYATGGLETSLQTALYVLAVWLFVGIAGAGPVSRMRVFALSVTFAMLMLVRYDSALIVGCLALGTYFHLWRQREGGVEFTRNALVLFLPAALVFGVYLAWCYRTYGDILPNTFYIKTAGRGFEIYVRGFHYAYEFLSGYGLLIPAAVAALTSLFLIRSVVSVSLSIFLGLWMMYVISIGGGFMEFRFFMPVLPILLILFGMTWQHFLAERQRVLGALVVLGFAVSSAGHGDDFGRIRSEIASFKELDAQVSAPHSDWIGIGKRLAATFPGGYDEGPILAVTPAGAISFYSKLRTIDMYGLNDRQIAMTGIPAGTRPGHQKIIDARDLVARGANLVIAHPQTYPTSEGPPEVMCLLRLTVHTSGDTYPDEILGARFLGLPVNDTFSVMMLYLTPHPDVEAAIASGELNYIRTRPQDCGGWFPTS